MALDEVQAAYDVALDRVLADLAATTDNTEVIVVDFTEPDLQYGFGTRHRMSLPQVEDAETATVELAGCVQDDVLEDLWGPPWPVCPGHPHPCVPVVADGLAVWTCPDNSRVIVPIGGLTGRP